MAIAISFPLLFAIAFKRKSDNYRIAAVRRVIAIRGAIHERRYEQIYKTDTKIIQRSLRAKNFVIAKMLSYMNIEKQGQKVVRKNVS